MLALLTHFNLRFPCVLVCKELAAYVSRTDILENKTLDNPYVLYSYGTGVNQEEQHTKVVAAKAA